MVIGVVKGIKTVRFYPTGNKPDMFVYHSKQEWNMNVIEKNGNKNLLKSQER